MKSVQSTLELYYLARNVVLRDGLDALEGDAIASLDRALDASRREMVKRFEFELARPWADGSLRDEQLAAWLDDLTLAVRSKMAANVANLSAEVAEVALEEHASIMSLEGRVGGVESVRLSPDQIKSFFVETPIGGVLLAEWADRAIELPMQRAIMDEMRSGALMGESTKDIVGRLVSGMNMAKQEAITLVRTYVQTANVEASRSVAEANARMLRGWRWSATLEPGYLKTGRGTCMRCAALDGQEFKLGHGPDIPLHPRCRCVPVWLTKSWRDLGIDADEMEAAARPYMMTKDQNIDEGLRRTIEARGFHTGDYADWFQKQDRAFRLNAIGPERLRLLEEGVVGFQDLVDADGNAIPVAVLKARQ